MNGASESGLLETFRRLPTHMEDLRTGPPDVQVADHTYGFAMRYHRIVDFQRVFDVQFKVRMMTKLLAHDRGKIAIDLDHAQKHALIHQ